MDVTHILRKAMAALRSRRGHSFLSFLACLGMAMLLWFVMALNDELQCDVRLPFVLTNVPDSVTVINTPPATVSVSLRARGQQRIRLAWGNPPRLNVDFRLYRAGNAVRLSNTDLKALARGALDGAQIILVSPDSLNMNFTTGPGVSRPVAVDHRVTAGPKSSIVGTPTLSYDSVRVYSLEPLPASVRSVVTAPVRLNDLVESTTVRVGLVPPPGTRVIPDSVDVTFHVEPLIFKTRNVAIEAVNVPDGMRLITFPSRIEVRYMIAMSDYKTSEPHMRVVADYAGIDHDNPTRNIRLRLVDVSSNLINVHLAADSAEYIIERL